MSDLTLGVVGSSRKEHERRVPIHPEHLQRLPERYRRQLVFEEGYGAPFGWSDAEISEQCGGLATRHELLADLGVVVAAKPLLQDFEELREGGILWGWPHCVQHSDVTQVAIDRKLTLIAFEEMFFWSPEGRRGRHTFYKNNEMAGYCAVLHALQLRGMDGHYGNQRRCVVFSFGSVSRGAIYALKALGFRDVTVCIRRPEHDVGEEILGCHYTRLREGVGGEDRMVVVEDDGTERSFLDLLSETDIMVNGTLQDPQHPLMFVEEADIPCLKRGSLIVDVSCDEGMGFSFAKPTSFEAPMFTEGEADYYAVDHTPSYLWESATRTISAALLVHLPAMVAGRDSWAEHETLRRALEIDEGVVLREEILSFQGRDPAYPHPYLGAETGGVS
ncbi:MAG TPA: N(5)-(carboxyethyl)ornithine synthase [Thermoleophilia bacterium]|nr:N(5)-(carboxyethyl)ornithine synthase [Thermoleophilia bacterium]